MLAWGCAASSRDAPYNLPHSAGAVYRDLVTLTKAVLCVSVLAFPCAELHQQRVLHPPGAAG